MSPSANVDILNVIIDINTFLGYTKYVSNFPIFINSDKSKAF